MTCSMIARGEAAKRVAHIGHRVRHVRIVHCPPSAKISTPLYSCIRSSSFTNQLTAKHLFLAVATPAVLQQPFALLA